jgi:hypothetical protein
VQHILGPNDRNADFTALCRDRKISGFASAAFGTNGGKADIRCGEGRWGLRACHTNNFPVGLGSQEPLLVGWLVAEKFER